MVYDYNAFLTKYKALSFEDAGFIHLLIETEVGTDQDALELYDELVKKSIEYASIRASWTLMSHDEKMSADEGRTMKHDSLIIKFNQLAKYLQLKGQPAMWRDLLGYEKDDKMNRKKIGDMGCYLAFVHALNAR